MASSSIGGAHGSRAWRGYQKGFQEEFVFDEDAYDDDGTLRPRQPPRQPKNRGTPRNFRRVEGFEDGNDCMKSAKHIQSYDEIPVGVGNGLVADEDVSASMPDAAATISTGDGAGEQGLF